MFRLINNLKNEKGFTLIELIVVLAVLAVIMAIAVPRFSGIRKQATEDSDIAAITSISKLVELELAKENVSKDSDAAGVNTVNGKKIFDLIKENFDESSLFQTDFLKKVELNNDNVKAVYSSNRTVSAVIIDSYKFEKENGKFKLPLN